MSAGPFTLYVIAGPNGIGKSTGDEMPASARSSIEAVRQRYRDMGKSGR